MADTCSCTPLRLPDGQMTLLMAALDPLPADVLDAAGPLADDGLTRRLLPDGAGYVVAAGHRVMRGSDQALAEHRAEIESQGVPDASESVVRLEADGADAVLVVYLDHLPSARTIADIRADEGVSPEEQPQSGGDDLASMPEPMLPLGIEPIAASTAPVAPPEEWVDAIPAPAQDRALSSLFDRLAEDAGLYSTLTAADEVFTGSTAAPDDVEPPAGVDQPPLDSDMVGAVIDYADDPEAPLATPPVDASPSLWMITGRGFRALGPRPDAVEEPPTEAETAEPPETEPTGPPAPEAEPPPQMAAPEALSSIDIAPDAEAAERVSRYNFEELGRILTDRVSGDTAAKVEPEPPIAPRPPVAAPAGVINLNAETLVLNRLPLAILVFRDQQVLFANRALTDLLGHESVESLRTAGIASIFPAEEGANAGPVNRLIRRDGAPLPVTARLQSVSWQGRAALMLSASPADPIRGHEGAVRAFAEIAAEAREEGYLVADRAGIVTQLSGHGSVLLGRTAPDVVGRPIAVLVRRSDMEPLRQFLEQPARFAETTRPSLVATTEDGTADIVLFAEGQAGVVTGYFAFLRKRPPAVAAPAADDDLEPGLLGRLSRGIRRPLNTIIGFADLMRSATLGSPENARSLEYARDIRTAGLEIAVLVDELDDFTRLRDGRYAPRPSDVELGPLLESCAVRVREQAAAARVLVRSAVAEHLPRVRADRASLGQALLNLLASAIDQTPVGGSVILSAQTDEDGNVAVHIRDGAEGKVDFGERFVVFRDGVDKDGEPLGPARSSVGLALTRSLLAVNACRLSVNPTAGTGTLFALTVPAQLVVKDDATA
jgi:PAS domain-containing protein